MRRLDVKLGFAQWRPAPRPASALAIGRLAPVSRKPGFIRSASRSLRRHARPSAAARRSRRRGSPSHICHTRPSAAARRSRRRGSPSHICHRDHELSLAALRALGEERGRASREGLLTLPVDVGGNVVEAARVSSPVTGKVFPKGAENVLPDISLRSLKPANLGPPTDCGEGREPLRKPSNCPRRRGREGVPRERLGDPQRRPTQSFPSSGLTSQRLSLTVSQRYRVRHSLQRISGRRTRLGALRMAMSRCLRN